MTTVEWAEYVWKEVPQVKRVESVDESVDTYFIYKTNSFVQKIQKMKKTKK